MARFLSALSHKVAFGARRPGGGRAGGFKAARGGQERGWTSTSYAAGEWHPGAVPEQGPPFCIPQSGGGVPTGDAAGGGKAAPH